jgi:hypothetical protein
MAINKKVLGRLSRRFLTTPKFTTGRFGRRAELKLAGDHAAAVKGEPGARVRLRVDGIVTSTEGGRQKPNVVISVESVKQTRSRS